MRVFRAFPQLAKLGRKRVLLVLCFLQHIGIPERLQQHDMDVARRKRFGNGLFLDATGSEWNR